MPLTVLQPKHYFCVGMYIPHNYKQKYSKVLEYFSSTSPKSEYLLKYRKISKMVLEYRWYSSTTELYSSSSLLECLPLLAQGNNFSTACCIIAFVLETFKLMVTLICDVVFHESFCSFFLKVNFVLFFVTWYVNTKVLNMICSRSFFLYSN